MGKLGIIAKAFRRVYIEVSGYSSKVFHCKAEIMHTGNIIALYSYKLDEIVD